VRLSVADNNSLEFAVKPQGPLIALPLTTRELICKAATLQLDLTAWTDG
jgi:hypothetical protein